ncbi:MAG TPA: UDP-glucose--hexose-1-phosphate uridylyltransferase [Pyrinomonadaceae bacterium]|nr:UDP-glucose--hexose-1-phosphate uridylyltransferase [Pyrinomonadaceae bacterium]
MDLPKHPHRRYNPLTREWVLVSPQRTDRPWQGQVEEALPPKLSEYDPTCYLCPGNERAGGVCNPGYAHTFVFDNDFAALRPDTAAEKYEDGVLIAEAEPGICRVVCFSPRHDLTISAMESADLRHVIDVWVDQFRELGRMPAINSVQIFENRGAMMGASNPHPHGQIWAQQSLPNEVLQEVSSQRDYRARHESCLLCDYVSTELLKEERLVCQDDDYVVVVPFWAIWPFETLVIGKRHTTGLDQLSDSERDSLGEILKQLTSSYDRLFDAPFPYTMGFHQRPTDGEDHLECHLHAHFYPPLLRSATVRKFMVGYEMLAMPQRDITAEEAAARLRAVMGDSWNV